MHLVRCLYQSAVKPLLNSQIVKHPFKAIIRWLTDFRQTQDFSLSEIMILQKMKTITFRFFQVQQYLAIILKEIARIDETTDKSSNGIKWTKEILERNYSNKTK